MKKVLFICTLNTCRSSMAEGIGKKIIKDNGLQDKIEFSSAGLSAIPGEDAYPPAVEALKDLDIDLLNHKSRLVDEKLIKEADIILTMTLSHKTNLAAKFPSSMEKTYTLKEFAYGRIEDIEDPFGQKIDMYKKCGLEIKNCVEMAINRILAM